MWFLAIELWPYILAALLAGLATGWFAGCGPRRLRAEPPPPAGPAEDAV